MVSSREELGNSWMKGKRGGGNLWVNLSSGEFCMLNG